VEVDTRHEKRRPPKVKGEVLIHGHSHVREKVRGNMIHVGVDAWDFFPVPISDVAAIIRKRFPVEEKDATANS
jgi:calcineurin-like phosphoesterase family protein